MDSHSAFLEELKTVVDEKGAALFLGVTVTTMRNWRRFKRGPTYLKYHNAFVRYRREDLERFQQESVVNPIVQNYS